MLIRTARYFVAFATIVLINACSGTEAAAPSGTSMPTTNGPGSCGATANELQQQLLATSCSGAGCHGATMPAAGLDLVSGDLVELAGTSSALCAGWALVVPGSPEKSLLYNKLVASTPACGERMPLGKHISEAQAECVARWIRSLGAGGCEMCGGSECVSLSSDSKHCGECGNVCPDGVACESGACACPTGATACDGSCVSLMTDAQHCGACQTACGAGATCVAGACSCQGGLTACGDACSDVQSDPAHCGSCDQSCAVGEVCLQGACAEGCGALTECSGSCVDLTTNVLSCGKCGNTCAPGLTCTDGQCSCPSGKTLCGDLCVDTQADAANCGKCGNACGAGETCGAGSCACSALGNVSFAKDVAPILSSACTSAGCHSGMKPKEDLSLDATKAYADLVGVTASQCGGQRKLVVPGSPSSSYLMQKLLGVGVCTGTQMPKAGQSLPQQQLDAISAWICSGAPNN